MLKKAFIFVVLLIVPAVSTVYRNNNNLSFNSSSIIANFNTADSAQKVIAYVNPDNSYQAVSDIISSANESIYLVSYRFWSLDIYNLIYSRLQEKNSLRVRIVLENESHNWYLAYKFYTLKQTYGYDILIKIHTRDYYGYYYLHSKFIVVDNVTVFVSSENFIYSSYPPNPVQPKTDKLESTVYYPSRGWSIIVSNNTIASTFVESFENIFEAAKDYKPDEFGPYIETAYSFRSYSAPFEDQSKIDNHAHVIPFFSPTNSYETIINLITNAKRFILLELAYISNSSKSTHVLNLLNALKEAEERGVTVHIILEDNPPFDDDFNSVYNNLLEMGFNVVPAFSSTETDILFCHNKGIIVDGKFVIVGSTNWSEKSLTENWEAGVLVESFSIAKFYLNVYSWDWDHSSTVKFDSDGDGLSDAYEEEHGLDKADPDMDDDGFSDYTEVIILGSDPNDPNDPASASVEITSPVNYSYISSRSITVEWSTTGSVVEYYVYLNNSYLSTLSNDTTSYTLYLQDEHWYVFTLIAKVNDKVNVSSEVVFAIDTAPPQLSLIKPYNGSTFTTNEVEIAWHAEDFSSVNFSVFVDNVLVYNGTDTSCTVNLSVGQHTIVINAVDSAGNTASLTVIVKINEPPQPPEPQEFDFGLIIMITAFVLLSLLIIIVLKRK